jgi:hypothetical protein
MESFINDTHIASNYFNYIYYLKKHKDLRDMNINTYEMALNHWNTFGKIEQRYINIENDPYPFICNIYIICPIKEGGSYKYISDIINYLEEYKKNYIIIKNKEELYYMSVDFNNNDILIVQNLSRTNIDFTDIDKIMKINIILPIHDFYFIYANNNNIHKVPVKYNIKKITHNLLKIAKYVIFPSKFMMDSFIKITGVYDNYKLIYHNDNINYHYEHYIPRIYDMKINIGIITNINTIKGYSYYVKLCNINKYKKYYIHYYLFGNVYNKERLESKFIHYEGIYNEDDIYEKLKNKNIHGLMFMNNYPEAYSYALTKGINSQLPILYTNIGAIGERLNNINNRFHIYTNVNSFYNFMNYIIDNNGQNKKLNLKLNLIINPFYKELFNL